MSATQAGRSVAADHRRVVAAVLVMLFAGLCSSLLHIGVRYVSPSVPTTQIVFLRSIITILITLPIVLRSADIAWRTTRPGLQVMRGAIGVVSMSLWYYALANMRLADAGTLSFTTGLFVTLGAALFLGEQVGVRRWVAVAVGFIDALLVLRPGPDMLAWPAVAAVVSSALWAASLLLAKQLTKFDSTLTISFYQPMVIAPLALLLSLPTWVWPDQRAWMILTGMGVIAAVGNYGYVHALRTADASVVMPADYVHLVWMSGWGFVFFSEIPLINTWIGAMLIICATLFITVRESRIAVEQRRRATAPTSTGA